MDNQIKQEMKAEYDKQRRQKEYEIEWRKRVQKDNGRFILLVDHYRKTNGEGIPQDELDEAYTSAMRMIPHYEKQLSQLRAEIICLDGLEQCLELQEQDGGLVSAES